MNKKYTHRVAWIEYSKFFKTTLVKSFRTTSDAVQSHVRNLSRSKICSNVTVEVL